MGLKAFQRWIKVLFFLLLLGVPVWASDGHALLSELRRKFTGDLSGIQNRKTS